MVSKFLCSVCFVLGLFLVTSSIVKAQKVPSPAETFGFKPGADYKLADYEQQLDYYNKLARASDRVKKIELGKTVLGRPMILLFISSEKNLQHLDKWRSISEKLARARIDDREAKKLSKDGKVVVWIDMGLHSNELAPGQMAPELSYRLATDESDEYQHIRDNVITLVMPMMNPDGLDIIAGWYRDHLGTPYETTSPPWLFHHYVGHDNNRDWFMNNMPETKNVTKILYREWFPQIVYNHHQPAPSWTRISIPPYADPVNPKIPPAITSEVNEIGSAMATRFALKDMPGAIADNYYTMFWNGGDRTVPYYHNQVGILTETAHRTPTPRFYDPDSMPKYVATHIPTDGTDIFYPYPWKGGESHFRDAIDYTYTASMAVLNLAASQGSKFMYNMYRMGRKAIKAGQAGDPYAYVIPKKQWDEWEAKNLVNVLFRGGVEINQATRDFEIKGKKYSAGSYVIYAGQAFRPYLMDLLEKQNYPTRLQYPGGPPETPYDLAGWTLPMQMGVDVDRIDNPFEVATKEINSLINAASGKVEGNTDYGYIFADKSNASVKAANILLAKGAKVSRIQSKISVDGQIFPSGSYILSGIDSSVDDIADTLGLNMVGLNRKPDVETLAVKLPKIGLYKSWVANIDEGWTRWLLKQYHFKVDTLHDADIRDRDLSQYSSMIIPSQRASSILNGYSVREIPQKYTGGLGIKGALKLKEYAQQGGMLMVFDAASDFVIRQFGLPVRNAVQGLSSNQFFIPGSLIRSVVDTNNPLAFGMQDTVAVSFNHSRAFEIQKQNRKGEGGTEDIKHAPKANVDVVSRYADSDLLMSGWAMGENKYIAGKASMVRVPLGKGQVVMFGFRPQFRGQPRDTYKLIFNALYNSTMNQYPAVNAEE
ncbi:MAG TPA: M14 family metallopeptidase [Balneolaceae bacterium]|nr:M14 family metallopeptidase [Balneolaceae bacterium]